MISLKRIERTDAALVSALWGPDRLPGYRLPSAEHEMKMLIDEWNRGETQGRRFYMLLIEEDGIPAGLVSLFEREDGVSLGISVHPSFQRRGIGKNAVSLAADFARGRGWKRILSECREDNAASIALHEACGFVRTGERINSKGNRVICWEMIPACKIEKE